MKDSQDPQVRQGQTPTQPYKSGRDHVGRGGPRSLVFGHLETANTDLMTTLFSGWEIKNS